MNSPTWMYFVMYEYNPRERPSHNISTNNLVKVSKFHINEIKRKCAFFNMSVPALYRVRHKDSDFQEKNARILKINYLTTKNQVNHTSQAILFPNA